MDGATYYPRLAWMGNSMNMVIVDNHELDVLFAIYFTDEEEPIIAQRKKLSVASR
jgi:hypothetical protein